MFSVRVGVWVCDGFGEATRRDLVQAKKAACAHGGLHDVQGTLLGGRQLLHCLGELNLCRGVFGAVEVFGLCVGGGSTLALVARL